MTVVHPHDVLLDDRSFVEFLGDVVGGRADELDAPLLGSSIGRRADEGRQERVMNVDQRAADIGEELRRDDLHVAGEHHQIDVAA